MQYSTRPFSIAFATGALLLIGAPAFAHISLLEPTARYDGSLPNQSKGCPCGVGDSNRLCDVDGDRSDPDRSNNVTVLEAGSTVTLRWDEYVGHAGRYRIAFDDDGADLEDFNMNVLEDFPDPAGSDGNVSGSIWEMEFTVPDVLCDNCTIQLIQMMDGNMDDPVLDPVGRSSYYQCADIEIVAALPGDMGTPPSDMGTPPVGQDMGTTPVGQDMGTGVPGNNGNPPVMTGQDMAGAGADGGVANVHGNGGGGCAVAGSSRGGFALLLVALLGLFRRRRT